MTKHIFLKAHSIEEWKRLSTTTHCEQRIRLLKQADTYKDHLPPAEHPRDSITYIGMAAANLSLSYLLTDDESYIETLRDWIKVGIGYPHWGLARMPDHDLDASWLLFGLSLAYNWVGDVLPEDERVALRDKLVLQATRLYDFALASEGRWWSSAYWQNHNWICYGGLATAAVALMDDAPAAQTWLDRAVENFQIVLPLFPEDGSDYEGVVYWRYGFPWLLIAGHLVQETTGIDLHDSDFLRYSFHHRLHLSGPNLVDTANFGDCHDRRSAHSRMVMYRLASLYRIGEAQWLASHFEETGEWEREGREGLVKPGLLPEAWLDFVWFDPSVEPTPIADAAPSAVFPDMGLLTTRSSWDADATYLAFKCGTPNGARGWHLGHSIDRQNGWDSIKASHEHPDENSFILIRGNDYLAVDPGYSKEKLTRNHSTVLIDGRGQYNEGGYNAYADLDPSWGGRLQDWFVASGLSYACGEAAGAYSAELKLSQFRRQMVMVDSQLVVMCDDLASAETHEYQWLLQTDAAPKQTAPNQFVVDTTSTRMTVSAVAPAPLSHATKEIEIAANPTSAKPDWIIRRAQFTLSLSPAEPTDRTRFVVALDLADPEGPAAEVKELACEGGTAVEVTRADQTYVVAFAHGQGRIQVPDVLRTDAAWVVVNRSTGAIWAGGATHVWVDELLRVMADTPVDLALSSTQCEVVSKQATRMSIRISAEVKEFTLNDRPLSITRNPVLPLNRFAIEAGESRINWK